MKRDFKKPFKMWGSWIGAGSGVILSIIWLMNIKGETIGFFAINPQPQAYIIIGGILGILGFVVGWGIHSLIIKIEGGTFKKFLMVGAIILGILSMGYFGLNFLAVFEPKTQFLTQYGSGIQKCGSYGWMYGHDYPISLSDEAQILDYKIVTEKFDSGTVTEFKGCNPNSCNGQFVSKDEYGCDRWRGVTGELKCGLDHAYQCSCNTVGETKECGDRTVECRYSPCGCPMIEQTYTCYGTCGGANLNIIKSGDDCYSNSKLYYQNKLVYETGLIYQPLRINFREGEKVADISNADIHIDFHSESQYYSSSGRISCSGYDNGLYISKGCYSIINEYIFSIPQDAFNFVVEMPTEPVNFGDTVKARIRITNNWMNTSGRLDMEVNIPYKVFGMEKQTSDIWSNFVELKKGENLVEFDLPTEQVVNKIYITPSFHLLFPGKDNFKGVNYYCFEQGDTHERDISTCGYLLLGSLIGVKYQFAIGTTIIGDCTTNGCSEGDCNEKTGVCEKTNIIEKVSISVYLVIIALLVIIIYLARKRYGTGD